MDEAPDGTFEVWDYKTGSTWSVREGAGLRGGRQIQPALYAMAFDALLGRAGIPGRVARTGYFFPGRKGEGQRIVIRWTPRRRGTSSTASSTWSPPACSRTRRSGTAAATATSTRSAAARRSRPNESARKLAQSEHPALAAFREIHDEKG